MDRLKLLFVAHTVGFGGAARSLRELVRGYDVDADLAIPRMVPVPSDAEIRRFIGPNLRRIHRFWLPWSEIYVGHPTVRQSARSHLLFPITWRAQRRAFERFVRRERYDGVHLNSVVLHPMLTADVPMSMHVREIVSERHAWVRANAARARGVVFIDEATRKPFAPEVPKKHIVLNNPVNMTGVGTLPVDVEKRIGGDPQKLVVFAIIGDLTDEKGLPFVIESFRKLPAADTRLLLVGRAVPQQREKLERLAAGASRIVFWGEERDVAGIYTLADYVMRGEAYPCVGRTIYEALYAGAGVIVPGAAATHGMFEYERFADRIAFYPPRDTDAFVATLATLAGRKRTGKQGESNVERYVAEFDRFIRDALGKA
jgi:glycosyltransferase involved in cell wall biosynthesis